MPIYLEKNRGLYYPTMDAEKEIQAFWEKTNISGKLVQRNRHKTKLTVYDGPPFPTGPPHHGHMMTSAVKDTVIRYFMATGHYVPRLLGWDMHGPNAETDNTIVENYISEWLHTMKALGRWVDEEAYRTNSSTYRESIWWVFKTLYTKGHIVIGNGHCLYCPECDLSFSDFERYHLSGPVEEQTVYFRAKIAGTDYYLLVWEMRPSVLHECYGYAINPKEEYISVGNEISARKSNMTTDVGTIYSTEQLLKQRVIDPITRSTVPIYGSSLVDPVKGTGIVHLSPRYNLMSWKIWQDINAPPQIDWTTNICHRMGDEILTCLSKSGALISIRPLQRNDSLCPKCYKHTVIHPCYGGFYRVRELNNNLHKAVSEVYWEPKASKDKMLSYLEHANDWYITRPYGSRGTPVPIWHGPNGRPLVIGSYAELTEHGGKIIQGLDRVILTDFEYGGDTYIWSNWYFDNWMDSACMPYGSVQYPFRITKMELENSMFPSMLAVEGIDQVYGWFFATIAISSSLFNKPAFKNIITHGLVLEGGTKMSKSRNTTNRTPVLSAIQKHGADNYRVYLMRNRLLSGIDFDYDEGKISNGFTRNMNYIWTILEPTLKTSMSSGIHFKPTRITNITDNWILQALDNYLAEYHALMRGFKVSRALSAASSYNACIKKYIAFNRNRIKTKDSISVSVLLRVFYYFIVTTAPFVPFTAEKLYQYILPHLGQLDNMLESVHLCQIPQSQWRVNRKFLQSSDLMFSTVELVGKLKTAKDQKIMVYVPDVSLLRGVDGYIKEVTQRNIAYSADIESVMTAKIITRHPTLFSAGDHEDLENLSLRDILALKERGYYRVRSGTKTYPGQYVIRFHTNLEGGLTDNGIVAHIANDSLPIQHEERELVSKGQYIGRTLYAFIKEHTDGGKCVVYVEHRPIREIGNQKCRQLLTNLNSYTLPIVGQSIYQYRDQLTFAQTELSVYGCMVTFLLSDVELEDQCS